MPRIDSPCYNKFYMSPVYVFRGFQAIIISKNCLDLILLLFDVEHMPKFINYYFHMAAGDFYVPRLGNMTIMHWNPHFMDDNDISIVLILITMFSCLAILLFFFV